MARKSPKKEKADESAKVVVFADARELVTVPMDSALWLPKSRNTIAVARGAIVRLRPPASATDDDVRGLREAFEKAGAIRVVTLPRPKAEVLPEEARVDAEEPAGAREAVIQMVTETNTKDRGALSALCEKIMAEEGL